MRKRTAGADPIAYCPGGKSGLHFGLTVRLPRSFGSREVGARQSARARSRLFEHDSIADVLTTGCRGAIFCFADKVACPLGQGLLANLVNVGRQGDFF